MASSIPLKGQSFLQTVQVAIREEKGSHLASLLHTTWSSPRPLASGGSANHDLLRQAHAPSRIRRQLGGWAPLLDEHLATVQAILSQDIQAAYQHQLSVSQ